MKTHKDYWFNKETGELIGEDTGAKFRLENSTFRNNYRQVKIVRIGSFVNISPRADIEKYGLIEEHRQLVRLYCENQIQALKKQIEAIEEDKEKVSIHSTYYLEQAIQEYEEEIEDLERRAREI